MAVYPCTVCGQRYTGAQQTMYPALLHDSISLRQKTRLCPKCFETALDFLAEHAHTIDVITFRGNCIGCDVERPPVAFFVTVYEKGHERTDFFGYVCHSCSLREVLPVFFGPLADLGELHKFPLDP